MAEATVHNVELQYEAGEGGFYISLYINEEKTSSLTTDTPCEEDELNDLLADMLEQGPIPDRYEYINEPGEERVVLSINDVQRGVALVTREFLEQYKDLPYYNQGAIIINRLTEAFTCLTPPKQPVAGQLIPVRNAFNNGYVAALYINEVKFFEFEKTFLSRHDVIDARRELLERAIEGLEKETVDCDLAPASVPGYGIFRLEDIVNQEILGHSKTVPMSAHGARHEDYLIDGLKLARDKVIEQESEAKSIASSQDNIG